MRETYQQACAANWPRPTKNIVVITPHGYAKLKHHQHPRAHKDGYVYQHILVAEKALGRSMPEGVEVHHVNGIGSENQGNNLVICQDHAYHLLLHTRQRAFIATGNANKMRCRFCKQWDLPENLQRVSTRRSMVFHGACNRADVKERKPWRKQSVIAP